MPTTTTTAVAYNYDDRCADDDHGFRTDRYRRTAASLLPNSLFNNNVERWSLDPNSAESPATS